MGIRIKSISVKNLGPIDKFSETFKSLNLIFSKNEKGKSFLIEFIIKSLFKDTGDWKLRKDAVERASGKIVMEGVPENLSIFSPKNKNKLDKFLSEERGLPPSLKKLIVVKSGEVKIDKEAGVDKSLLIDVLSGKQLLAEIEKKIKSTVANADIREDTIGIKHQGKGKEYYDEKKKLEKLQSLKNRVMSSQHFIKMNRLEKEIKEINERIQRLLNKIQRWEKKIAPFKNIIPILEEKIRHYTRGKKSLSQEEKGYEELSKKEKVYQWLERAKDIYQRLSRQIQVAPKGFILFSGIGLEILSAILGIMGKRMLSIIFIFLGLAMIILYIWKLHKAILSAGEKKELERIREEFNAKTGNELKSEVDIDVALREYSKIAGTISEKQNNIERIKRDIDEIKDDILKKFQGIGYTPTEEEWDKQIAEIRGMMVKMQDDIDTAKQELEGLEQEKRKKMDEKNQTSRDAEILKRDIQNEIEDNTVDDWNELIARMIEKIEDVSHSLEDIEAEIIGKKLVYDVLQGLKEEEDKKIQEGLESKGVIKLISGFTDNHYNKIEWDKDALIVGNDYENFYLNDLSTGAIEQVMLALRIGFASKLLGGKSMFLILDDAFQHTDWDRRENLIKNQIPIIIQNGWQIIYLTMDDHIKGLFDEVGNKLFLKEYKRFEL